jgi:phosphate uptake regulator
MPVLEDPDASGAASSGPARPYGDGWTTRILQRMGPVSLGVSIPRPWSEAFDLRAGSAVRLRAGSDGSLRIRPVDLPYARAPAIQIEVTPGTVPEHLFRRLLGAYLAGYAAFQVTEPGGITPATQGVVRTFVRRTIQPEVLSEEGSVLELQDVTDASPVPLMKRLARMAHLVVALQRDAGTSWTRGSALAPAWSLRDDEVDRQAWFIERTATRLLHGEEAMEAVEGVAGHGIGPLGCWSVARSLERIGDHAVHMGEAGALLAESSAPRSSLVFLEQFHAQALDHLGHVLEALAEESSARANELLDTGEALHETGRALAERIFPASGAPGLPASTVFALGRILESIDRTVAYAQDIAQVALDRALPPSRPRDAPAARSPRPSSLGPTGPRSHVSGSTKTRRKRNR